MARREPQNIDADISVLGCGFLEKSALDKIMDEVNDDMFYSEANKLIYKTMKTLHTNNIPVDANTVCNELDKSKSLSKVGGVEYITELIKLNLNTPHTLLDSSLATTKLVLLASKLILL